MTELLYIIIIAAALLIIWIIMLTPRIKGPSFKPFQGYDYAHRGLFNENEGIDENSLTAFRRAVDKGFGIEMDVHLTKDGKLVVMHDESLRRTSTADVKICDLTLAQLNNYTLRLSGEKIPTLPEALEIVNGKVPLIIELKAVRGNHGSLARAVTELLASYKGHYCIESFDPRVLLWLKKNRPEIIRGQLVENYIKHNEHLNPIMAFFLQNLFTSIFTKPDFIAYRVQDRGALALRLSKFLFNIQEFSWTVSSKKKLEELKQEGVLVIFEYPEQRL